MNRLASRRSQRGLNMIEVLIVLGILAFVISGTMALVGIAQTNIIANRNVAMIGNFDSALSRFKTVRRVCGTDPVPTNAFGVIGANVTATRGSTSPPHAAPVDAQDRCENHIWESFTGAVRRPTDTLNGEGVIAYDDDDADEWIIAGGGETAIEVGWFIWPPAAGFSTITASTIGADESPCTPAAGASGPAAIAAFAMEDSDICEATRSKLAITPEGIYATSCTEQPIAGTRDGDAMLLACILDVDA